MRVLYTLSRGGGAYVDGIKFLITAGCDGVIVVQMRCNINKFLKKNNYRFYSLPRESFLTCVSRSVFRLFFLG
ncbi:hypothetical protein AtEden1_Chr3g0168061 [Arabidopsis thaliana]